MIDIKSYTLEALTAYMESLLEKPFRGKQLFKWLHDQKVLTFNEMNNMPNGLLERLKSESSITQLATLMELSSKSDGTKKYLFKLQDGHTIETVLMRYQYGYSICISSQVGCKMGCTFCASALGGLVRNLTASELLEQIYAIERIEQTPCHSIVVMGTGEPFDNYDHLITMIHLLNHPEGRNLGQRHITVSTSGLVPKIKEFADLNLQVNLAISLHSVDNEARSAIMPINRKYDLESLKEACEYYISKTNRRITFEYTLIEGVNDSKESGERLAKWLKGMLCHVNLIPLNPYIGSAYKKSNESYVMAFKKIIDRHKIPVTIRRSLGNDIDSACGQLRHKQGVKE